MPEARPALAAALLLAACAGGDGTAALAGRDWRLIAIGQAPVAAPDRTTLRFLEDGRIAGEGGCNRYSGAAELSEDAVRFGPILATKRACEPEVTRQEVRLFEGLREAAAWRLENGELSLRDANGRELLRFEP